MSVQESSKPSPEQIRDEAVYRVDRRHGYTVVFAPDSAAHRDEYDRETLYVTSLARQCPWEQIKRDGLRGPHYTTGPNRDQPPRDLYSGEGLEP